MFSKTVIKEIKGEKQNRFKSDMKNPEQQKINDSVQETHRDELGDKLGS